MQKKLKYYALVGCLFVFLFVIIGGGLHLAPVGAFLAALTGTPLAIYVFRRKFSRSPTHNNGERDSVKSEVQYASDSTDDSEY
jgi:Na+/glutamate symporter